MYIYNPPCHTTGPKQNSNRGFGRGRGSFSRVSRGVHHAMKIKARAGIGSFRNLTRGQFRGSLRGRGSVSVTRGRGTTNFANRALGTRSKAPGSFQSSGQTAGGTGSPKASFSGLLCYFFIFDPLKMFNILQNTRNSHSKHLLSLTFLSLCIFLQVQTHETDLCRDESLK